MNINNKRHSIFIATVVVLVLIGIVGMLILLRTWSPSFATACPSQLSQPSTSSSSPNFTTTDYKAMASFSGYLKYYNPDQKNDSYLKLDLKSIAWTGDELNSKLSLATDCATVDLYLIKQRERSEVILLRVEMDVSSHNATCTVQFPKITFANDKHYASFNETEYPCEQRNYVMKKKDYKTQALVISQLEFEVDSDPYLIKHGEFTTVRDTTVQAYRPAGSIGISAILSSYRIDNKLSIYGISIDGPTACLVTQFMACGSLESQSSYKKESRPLVSRQQRAQIGEGVAKGLYYLHTSRDKPFTMETESAHRKLRPWPANH